ncbi:PadR family transcriptional regulator [Lacticaseibacillus casei]|jgi:PadR family transcriptional regulator PadR|uniref:PadR family transcriptional regulator n=1 Tax=Lacticaseibacillus huelsenbergensis TaxID=3035291 RepID=A0ABY8DVG5_9LACO|nr:MULTISPECIES: PadR family transcriptional regulator [Lacticaseibacillus]MDG3061467.1 PadR family transcriptional regulator [Lacticaseibacillus sp. BCRC 81376]QVI36989.1 PadR family transcriptional regulator [Lacticaseibacillus casei]QXG58780.1 PadR family transcriptional regulator [Lacticaseibacillus casei]WFB39777.1 PadR family transcriptional regulator [Lacticaseibacillus huelsenbergensis]WFB41477.1 PadR family transcriptional regulator [Lacticaseibacillus huelsenbergensis]
MGMPLSAELLDGIVLAVLQQSDAYGYALTQQIQAVISISPSTLYPVLRRLKAQGALTTYDQPYEGRNRRYYRITPVGSKLLQETETNWQTFKQQIEHFLPDAGNQAKEEKRS